MNQYMIAAVISVLVIASIVGAVIGFSATMWLYGGELPTGMPIEFK